MTEIADLTFLTKLIDEVLVELGTSTLIDGRKARDMVLDIRSIIAAMASVLTPEVEDVVPTL